MASSYNRKSASSGSRRASSPSRARGTSRTPAPRSSSARPASSSGYRAIPGGQLPKRRNAEYGRVQPRPQARPPLSSVRVGDLDRAERNARAQRTYRRHLVRLSIAGALLLALVAGGAALYASDVFSIESVQVSGVEHLTATEMTELAAVPADTTPSARRYGCHPRPLAQRRLGGARRGAPRVPPIRSSWPSPSAPSPPSSRCPPRTPSPRRIGPSPRTACGSCPFRTRILRPARA